MGFIVGRKSSLDMTLSALFYRKNIKYICRHTKNEKNCIRYWVYQRACIV